MAETQDRNGGNGFVYFMIGALVVAVGVVAWFAFAQDNTDTAELRIEIPEMAAPEVEAPDLPDEVEIEVDEE